ncbi:hypothetical protein JJB09_13685 [Rhizobium sp. KVB221]|uniref:Uncharacterized protein n=1 Tax=Rhizobium setariae TaxID=2801340 RepID=A0A936YU06_9HYPH|nr:hypothetical protein [Rhizobium setariae]MBL0373081.1 hypothetical protein [Rhizobium setariae]
MEATKTPEGNLKALTLTASSEQIEPVSLTMDVEFGAPDGTLAGYEFDPGTPTFIVTNYSMGAHCCTMARALTFDDVKLVPVDVGDFDGSALSIRDLDNDGTVEIDSVDQRFLYAFDSYAMSLAARKIMKIRGVSIDDVTADPPYETYLISQITKYENECYNGTSAGLCAGLLGTAAKVGLYSSIASRVPFKAIDAAMEKTYLECSAEDCGQQKMFGNFREAVESRLKSWNYNTTSSMNDRVRDYFRTLASYRKGFGSPSKDQESPCAYAPVKFSMNKDETFVHVEGQEYTCRVERVNTLGNAAVGLGLCTSEGENYSTLLAMELKNDTLYMNSIFNGGVYSNREPAILPACR